MICYCWGAVRFYFNGYHLRSKLTLTPIVLKQINSLTGQIYRFLTFINRLIQFIFYVQIAKIQRDSLHLLLPIAVQIWLIGADYLARLRDYLGVGWRLLLSLYVHEQRLVGLVLLVSIITWSIATIFLFTFFSRPLSFVGLQVLSEVFKAQSWLVGWLMDFLWQGRRLVEFRWQDCFLYFEVLGKLFRFDWHVVNSSVGKAFVVKGLLLYWAHTWPSHNLAHRRLRLVDCFDIDNVFFICATQLAYF